MSNANAIQVGGSHYKTSTGVQHWDIVENYKVGYLEGCASKYVLRWRKKNGLEDLHKAAHFLRKLYECRSNMSFGEYLSRMPNVPNHVVTRLCCDAGLCGTDEQIIRHILTWQSTATVDLARRLVEELIAEVESVEDMRGYVNQG